MHRTDLASWLAQLETETGSTGAFFELELEFLESQGITSGTLDDRWFQYLRDKGYTGSLQDMWRDAEAADDFWPAAAGSCTPALTGAYAGALGASAYTTITGQSYSATGNGTYTASSDFGAPFAVTSGVVGNEFHGTAFDGTKTYALLEPAGAEGIAATLAGTTWTIQAQVPFTNTTGSTTVGGGSVTDVVFLGVDKSTGEGLCYINGVKVTTGTWATAAATIFSSTGTFAYYARDQILSGGTASGSVVTNEPDMTHSTYGLTKDWCGNAV